MKSQKNIRRPETLAWEKAAGCGLGEERVWPAGPSASVVEAPRPNFHLLVLSHGALPLSLSNLPTAL